MKKTILSLVVAIVAVTATFAQSSMLATLSHNGEISTFYGATALREAYNAADNGDIITLSSGSFVSVDIQKALTIRGAGMGIDATAKTEPTIIIGDFYINIADDIAERLTIEGIYHNHNIVYKGSLKNATFIKDRFKKITRENSSIMKNATFIHCIIGEEFILDKESSACCLNCVVWEPKTNDNSTSNFECVNCVIYRFDPSGYLNASSFKNCIFMHYHTGYSLDSSNTVFNCVTVRGGRIFDNIPNSTNRFVASQSLFKNMRLDVNNSIERYYNDNLDFELTDEAKTNYLGTDGTQVGIYGGNMPFSSTPTNPQITKCNVAAKSTADGKLSVDITVGGAE